jgi:hypothetical protein
MERTVTQQRLHSNLAPIDVLTREELGQELQHQVDEVFRTRYLGLELQRIPEVALTATGTGLFMFTSNDSTPWGPEQGDIWMLRRVIVKSSVLTDTAKYVVFRGSTPSDTANQYTARQLLEAGVGGATPGFNVNVGYYPGTKAVFLQPGEQVYAQVFSATAGNQYVLGGEAIRCPAEMKGKLL